MNQIPQRQNEDRFLQLLAAQRQLYDEEKKGMTIWTGIATALAILGTSAIAIMQPFTPLLTWITLMVVVGEFAVVPVIVNRRKNAAKIQETLDCELLDIEWNQVLAGSKPEPEVILSATQKFREHRNPDEWEKLKDWYSPTVGNLPLPKARIACQKENIWWDSRLRRAYARWVFLVTGIVFFAIITIGIGAKWTLAQFFQGPLLLTLPALALGLKHGYDHYKSANRLDELKRVVDELWKDVSRETVSHEVLAQRTRQLQDEIFRHRSENPPVFSWFYKKLQKRFEQAAGMVVNEPVS